MTSLISPCSLVLANVSPVTFPRLYWNLFKQSAILLELKKQHVMNEQPLKAHNNQKRINGEITELMGFKIKVYSTQYTIHFIKKHNKPIIGLQCWLEHILQCWFSLLLLLLWWYSKVITTWNLWSQNLIWKTPWTQSIMDCIDPDKTSEILARMTCFPGGF